MIEGSRKLVGRKTRIAMLPDPKPHNWNRWIWSRNAWAGGPRFVLWFETGLWSLSDSFLVRVFELEWQSLIAEALWEW